MSWRLAQQPLHTTAMAVNSAAAVEYGPAGTGLAVVSARPASTSTAPVATFIQPSGRRLPAPKQPQGSALPLARPRPPKIANMTPAAAAATAAGTLAGPASSEIASAHSTDPNTRTGNGPSLANGGNTSATDRMRTPGDKTFATPAERRTAAISALTAAISQPAAVTLAPRPKAGRRLGPGPSSWP